MKAYIFPGQASQFEGMGKDMYESSTAIQELWEQANEILGFRITDIMFEGTADQLKETNVTQPAVFLHSIGKVLQAGDSFVPGAVAGHSLGEFSALVAAKALKFEDGLKLVKARAEAMQEACEAVEGTMAAIVGLEDEVIEEICNRIDEVVVAANYNCPGQLVISGSVAGVDAAVEELKLAGAKMAIKIPVGGAFHSPLMKPAEEKLRAAIETTHFDTPICPIYQNFTATAENAPDVIKANLISQLTGPVRWTQSMKNMIADGVTEFIEVGGNGKTLRGFVMRLDRRFPNSAL
ncbi:MAG: ACP S-malonyltransferase [Saprospiraceae bacterium]|nr:ACP S-malonyltransferase [Saprospiraceae bacterium]